MLIHGGCHCANIAFDFRWDPDPTEIPARACSCSFCTRHGGVWTSHAGGSLHIRIRESSLVSAYSFGTRTAVFHVCAVCGVAPVVTSLIDDHLYAVVNVNAFENVNPPLLRRTPASFEGEDADSRLARRKRNWIADVQVHVAGAP